MHSQAVCTHLREEIGKKMEKKRLHVPFPCRLSMHAARGLLLALGIGLPRAQCNDVLHAIQRAMQRGNVATWQPDVRRMRMDTG